MERTQTTLRLPEELMEQLRAEAEKRKQSWCCLVQNILWMYLRRFQV